MKLDSFFTSAEVTDGIESIPRVEQLVSLMRSDEYSITRDAAEATQCWSTVAKILTATKNMDCLGQFVKSGGLCLLDKWLQEAQMRNIDGSNKPVEDLITSALGALVKLPIVEEGLKACGISDTVKNLHSHRNMEIQGCAKLLSDGWEKLTKTKIELEKNENGSTTETVAVEGVEHWNSKKTSTPLQHVLGEVGPKEYPSDCKSQHSSSNSNGVHFEAVKNRKDIDSSPREITGDGNSVHAEVPRHSSGGISSTVNLSAESGASSGIEESSKPTENKELGVSDRKSQQKTNADGSTSIEIADLNDKQLRTVPSSSNLKTVFTSVSSSNDGSWKVVAEAKLCANNPKGKQQPAAKNALLEMAEDGSLKYWMKIMKEQSEMETVSYISSQVIKNTSTSLLGKPESLAKTCQDVEKFRADNVRKVLHVKSGLGVDAEEKPAALEKINFPSQNWSKKNEVLVIGKDADMEVSYELDDALEVARRVAKEVEREVGIYREASGSSSSVEDGKGEESAADSAELKKSDCLKDTANRSESHSCCSTKEEMDEEMSAKNKQLCSEVEGQSQEMSSKEPGTDDGLHDQESYQLTTMPEAHVAVNERLPSFDLNKEVQTEEIGCTVQSVTATFSSCHVINLSTPIPVIAISRSPACMPTTPLHFEGELGWRGCAATSAFRPASFYRIPDKEKAGYIEENKRISKGFCDIDLNVADCGDDLAVELLQGKHVPGSSARPSGDSSAEVNSKRAERLNLDLNRLSDNDDNCPDLLSDWRMDHTLHPGANAVHSPSLMSSSRASIRDFDLNDNPAFSEAHNVHSQVHGVRPSTNGISDDRASSVIGPTMYLESKNVKRQADLSSVQDCDRDHGRKGFLYSAQPFVMAGSNVLPSGEQMGRAVTAQPTLTYAHPPIFSYDGFGLGPAVPFPAIYPSGAVQYMVDSRGATILPQVLGPSTLSSYHRAPYLLDAIRAPSANDIGIGRPNLGLNAGTTSLETETRGGNVKHLFFPANSNSLMEEQMKSFQLATISGSSMKRKEPDCGWETYQVGCKQMTSWH